MKAVAIESYGGRETLRLMELPRPVPEAGEVLIRVKAAGVNPVDGKIRQGLLKDRLPNRFPLIPGWDAAGIVEGTGEAVMAYCRKPVIQHGAYAEYIAVPQTFVARKPARLSFEEAAGIPLAGLTAWQCLFDAAGIRRGQRVLIHAGAGGVGGFAVQLARHAGAEVWATAGAKNIAYVKSLGAAHVIDYTAGDFRDAARDMDLVLDTVGGEVQTRSADVLRRGGTLVSILAYADEAALQAKGIVTKYVFVSPNGAQLGKLADLADAGHLAVRLAAVLPLAEAAQAHALIETRHTAGKIVLRVE